MKNPYRKPKVKKESSVERHLVKRVVKFGGLERKVTFVGHNGAPDRVVMFPGVLVWVETKNAKGETKAHQQREHERLRMMGQRVEVPRTEHEVEALVEELYTISQRYI